MDPKWFESVSHVRLDIDHGKGHVSWVNRDGSSEYTSTRSIPEAMDEAVEDTRWIHRPLVRVNHDLIRNIKAVSVARERGF